MTQRADTSMKPHAIYVRSTLRSLIVRVNGRPQVHNRESITPMQELTLPKQFETVTDFLSVCTNRKEPQVLNEKDRTQTKTAVKC